MNIVFIIAAVLIGVLVIAFVAGLIRNIVRLVVAVVVGIAVPALLYWLAGEFGFSGTIPDIAYIGIGLVVGLLFLLRNRRR